MCFWRCPCWKNFSIIWRCWYNFSYYTTSYTTTCVTFIDRFTIWKEKSSVLIKLVFCFLFTNCSPKFSVSSCSRHIVSVGYGSEKTLPSRSCQVRFIPCRALCLEQTLMWGPAQSWYLGLLFLDFFFFIHLHHLRLPLHQIGMYKAGSVGSGQAIFLPFAWPGGDFAAESSSAWPRERPPQSRSSPATPWAVFLAVPHYLAFRGMWMKKRKNNMTDQRPHRKNFRETYSWYD